MIYTVLFSCYCGQLRLCYSVDGDMRYMVYKWGFPCLDYPLKISTSWIYLLSPYNWFCHICTSHLLEPPSCLGVYAHDIVFNACFWIRFINTSVLIPARHLAFTTHSLWSFWLPGIFMSRSRSLELVDSSGYWSVMRSGSVNHQWLTIRSPILLGPLLVSRNFLL